ncbi:hypothetical protein HGA34_05010, partial [Candidatus Falkowbacteria bacterium]|nr:hypothetical protein [Candidatus Falkowbacteria bacterium]
MLRIFHLLQSKVQQIEFKLAQKLEQRLNQPYASSIFYFGIIGLNVYLVFWQVVTDLYKFLVILFADPGNSFNLFFRQRELRSCPFSYASYKKVQGRVRLFSLAGVTAIVAVSVMSSLITNLLFGGKLPTWAATKDFKQIDWSNGVSAGFATMTGWDRYLAASSTLNLSGQNIALNIAASSTTQTTDADFNAGATSSTAVGGNSVKLAQTSQNYSLSQTTDSVITPGPGNLTGGFNNRSLAASGMSNVVANGSTGASSSIQLAVQNSSFTNTFQFNDGRYTLTRGMTIDSAGNIYLVDGQSSSGHILKYSPDGSTLLLDKTGFVSANDNVAWAYDVAVDSAQNFYFITKSGIPSFKKYNSSGGFVYSISHPGGKGITIDQSGYLYVANDSGFKIDKYRSSDGGFVAWLGWDGGSGYGWHTSGTAAQGTANGQFYSPADVTLDSSGNIYVTDYPTRVQKFAPDGTFLSATNSYGGSNMQVAVDSAGYIYLTGNGGTMHTRLNSSFALVSSFSVPNVTQGYAVTSDNNGNVYFSGRNNTTAYVSKYGTVYTYYASGTYTSYFDAGTALNNIWNNFSWTETVPTANVTLFSDAFTSFTGWTVNSGTVSGNAFGNPSNSVSMGGASPSISKAFTSGAGTVSWTYNAYTTNGGVTASSNVDGTGAATCTLSPINNWYSCSNSKVVSAGSHTINISSGAGTYIDNLTITGPSVAVGPTISYKVKATNSTTTPSFASGTCDIAATGSNGTATLNTTCASSTNRYLWYQATLNASADQTQNPTLDSANVSVNVGSYLPSGTFTSSFVDLGRSVSSWNNLAWTNPVAQPFSVKVRSGRSNGSIAPTVKYINIGTSGSEAWETAGVSLPLVSALTSPAGGNKNLTSASDSSYWETKLTTGHDQYDYQIYRLKSNYALASTTGLTINWRGYGEAQAGYDVGLYLWNNNGSSWEELDTGHLAAAGDLTGNKIAALDEYIDGSGYIYVAASSRHYNYAPNEPASPNRSVATTSNSATMSWAAYDDLDGDSDKEYYVEFHNGAGCGSLDSNSGWISATDWNKGSLADGGYSWRIKSRNSPQVTPESNYSACSNFSIGIGPVCGNGVQEAGEQCDSGGGNGACPAACSASCTNNGCGGVASSTSFGYTGAFVNWIVPTGVTSISVVIRGGGGGSSDTSGGSSDLASSTLSVTPGATLKIYVGGAGGSRQYYNGDDGAGGGSGGFGYANGTGGNNSQNGWGDNYCYASGSGGGGGSSAVVSGSTRLIEAKGGQGGYGYDYDDYDYGECNYEYFTGGGDGGPGGGATYASSTQAGGGSGSDTNGSVVINYQLLAFSDQSGQSTEYASIIGGSSFLNIISSLASGLSEFLGIANPESEYIQPTNQELTFNSQENSETELALRRSLNTDFVELVLNVDELSVGNPDDINWAADDITTCPDIGNGASISSGNSCVRAGDRFVQYRAAFSTADPAQSPSLDNITFGYNQYQPSGTLISNAYDTGSFANMIAQIQWYQNLAAGTGIKFQISTAPDNAGAPGTPGTWSAWLGPDDASTFYTSAVNGAAIGQAINTAHATSSDNRWFRYLVTLESDGANTPTLLGGANQGITIVYVANEPPEVAGVTAHQVTTSTDPDYGKVFIGYQARDIDTITDNITPSFEYSTNGGSSYSPITAGLSVAATATKAVATSTFNAYQLSWDPKQSVTIDQIANARIRVIANDGEAARSSGSSDSADFVLDSRAPVSAANYPVIVASSSPRIFRFSTTDNSPVSMRYSDNPTDYASFSPSNNAGWVDYAASATSSLSTNPLTIYAQFRDLFGNVSTVQSATTPETPQSFMIQDTSNIKDGLTDFRLFFAWKVVSVNQPSGSFSSYNIYRSTDGQATFHHYGTITSSTINYFTDNNAPSIEPTYYYVTTKDGSGNDSFVSPIIQAQADGYQNFGEGGGGSFGSSTEELPPAIKGGSINHTAVYTTQATINWETTKLADSLVYYKTSAGCDFSDAISAGSATLRDEFSHFGGHTVTLLGLNPNTTYYYQVRSAAGSLVASSTCIDDGYSFTTQAGPAIIPGSVSTANVGNTTIDIAWDTDQAADSYV